MSNKYKPDDGDRLERFFDNLMSEQEAAEFVADRKQDAAFLEQLGLQKRIDAALRDIFSFESPSPSGREQTNAESDESDLVTSVKPTSGHLFRLVRLVLAASLIGVVVWYGWQILNDDSRVVFQPVPLAQVYHETVDGGFKPYYECHDMQRFAQTFEHRQGIALTLEQMPEDRRMLGLSFLGGVSREATSMLCQVQEQPILVFIDKVSNDRNDLAETREPELKIFREEKFGLVFYEVTPLDQATMIKYFALANQNPEAMPDND